jgi:hypothetical protein
MGPWFIRDEQHPFRPGCSYETILTMASRGKITAETILRGPSTSQFWYPAKRVPGVAHRLAGGGVCHSCQHAVTTESECPRCGAVFHADPDRQFLGLMPVRALPGSMPVPEPRQPSTPPPIPSNAKAFAASGAQPAQAYSHDASPRSSISANRLDSEIAMLRRRTGILVGVAAGCALVALGAIWLLASGIAQIEKAVPSNPVPSPSVAQGVSEAPAPEPAAASPASQHPDAAQTNAESQPTPPPAPVSDPGEKPDSDPSPSDELASLRAIRWP